MVPQASSVFFAVLPLGTCSLLLLINPDGRSYEVARRREGQIPRKLPDFTKRYLGVSIMLLGAAMLVTFGFGYLQHLISFSPVMEGGLLGGIITQLARGAASVSIFVLFLVLPQKMSVVYRVGFLVMVAGVMMMPFCFNGGLFVAPGACIIAGYTVFDVFIWVVFCQMSKEKSEDPLKTIVLIRLIASLFSAAGAIAGILLVGTDGVLDDFASQTTTVVGYLIVIAIVLILSGEDSRGLFASAEASCVQGFSSAGEGVSGEEYLDVWFEESGLTAREKEIAGLLAQGRTQPWIAESLKISENTVGTHVRHIYQKTNVHDRQQFIDQALCPSSPLSREEGNRLMEHA